jgi:glucose/mannose-6-phosphate isomerase
MRLEDKSINLNEARLKSLDPGDMLGKTLELPDQLERGLELGRDFCRKHPCVRFDVVDWVGLGGSAVSGDLLCGFGFEPPEVLPQIRVLRFPGRIQHRRMLCSYSGNTVETVSAFDDRSTDDIWFCMSSGGKLKQLAAATGVSFLELPGGYPPRAAVGFSLGAMIAILGKLNHLDDDQRFAIPFLALRNDAKTYRILNPVDNPALAEAVRLVNRTPIIYTVDGRTMPALAVRFRAQLAENSKVWSHAAELPELAHNEVESFEFLTQLEPQPRVIFLGSWNLTGKFGDPRPGIENILTSSGATTIRFDPEEMWGRQPSRLAAGLRLMLFLDSVTIYMSFLRAIDPLEIPMITRLKEMTK